VAVAAYGIILRGSEHKGEATFDLVLKLAKASMTGKTDEYRTEFVELVTKSSLLTQ
jgi:Ca-activated chloride channel family protein